MKTQLNSQSLEFSQELSDEDLDGVNGGGKFYASLDALSNFGELESLRLQMVMDRAAKSMSSLSNILKKMSDTSQSIISNLK